MIKLIWCRYESEKGSRYLLALELGLYNGKLYCLENDQLSRNDIAIIRHNKARLSTMEVKDMLEWIFDQCTTAKAALRTLNPSKMTLLKDYDIK